MTKLPKFKTKQKSENSHNHHQKRIK